MNFKLYVLTFILIAIAGCNPRISAEKNQDFPSSHLQITYIKLNEDQNYSELYTLDITCMKENEICFDKPKLLFRSLKVPNSKQNVPKGFITDYSWSPDGNNIVLVSGGDILIGDINSNEWINITNTPEAEHKPQWSSDGNFIYYIRCLEDSTGTCTPQLLQFDLTSKEKKQLLRTWDKYITPNYAISPDGQKIVFAIAGPLAISDLLYQANWDGTDSHQLTTEDVGENDPSFSPDGQQITFVRSTIQYNADSMDKSDIILKDLLTGQERNLTNHFDNQVFSPVFSHNGKWILFDAFDQDLNINIYLVSLEKETIFQITEDNESSNPAWRRIIN